MSEHLFLSDADLAKLTGFKIKSKQIDWLRTEGLPFRISATGHPVVTRSAVEGREDSATAEISWTPGLVGG
ncbi:DUF4224 domain-containing protein [Variovorax paradoxus]|uniref:DUF4224 domain-containing protein n=1 Tax=Variovorax paradoxus TaxID=34073 RepID=UPI0027D7A5F7|nr:DUF4224 domain-containing protein [Variovorax paradoxus]